MKALDIFSMAFEALKSRKLRAALTILGIVIGIATIVVLISLTDGLRVSVTGLAGKTGASTLTLSSVGEFLPGGRGVKLTSSDVRSIKLIEGVSEVIPYVSGRVTLSAGGKSYTATVMGIDNDLLPEIFSDMSVAQGTLLSTIDYSGIVVGYNVAYPPDSPGTTFTSVGQLLSVETEAATASGSVTSAHTYVVKGVLSEYGTSLFVQLDDSVFLSLPAANMLLKRNYGDYDGLIVVAKTIDDVSSITTSLEEIYGSNVRIMSSEQLATTIGSMIGQIQLFLGAIAAISLVVAGVGIANIMYISVIERTRIIGLFKAVGSNSRTIMVLFLTEAAIIGVLGGGVGCSIGAVMAYVAGWLLTGFQSQSSAQTAGTRGGAQTGLMGGGAFRLGSLQPVFTPQLIIIAIGFGIIVSVVAGFFPARKAAKLDPATALRYE